MTSEITRAIKTSTPQTKAKGPELSPQAKEQLFEDIYSAVGVSVEPEADAAWRPAVDIANKANSREVVDAQRFQGQGQ